MPLSRHTSYSHAVKNACRSKDDTENMPKVKTEQVTSGMKPDHCMPQLKRQVNRSSFHIYKININEDQKIFDFNRGKTSVHTSFPSPPMLM